MIAKFFTARPVFTSVISVFIILAGLMAIFHLPVEQFPNITPPQIMVTAVYPGASADVVEKTVATPLELGLNGVEGMLYMQSTSTSDGMMNLSLTFEVGTDPDRAEIDVNNLVKVVENKLPQEVRRQGINVQKQSSSIVLIAALESRSALIDDIVMSNYASINILDELKRIPGVGNVMIFGGKDYAMRVWVKPDRLAFYNLTVGDVIASINEQNAQYPVGKVGELPSSRQTDLLLSIQTHGRLVAAEEFGDIMLRVNPDGSAVKLKDVARIELGTQDYSTFGRLNDKAATLIAVFPQPGANVIQVSSSVVEKMEGLSKDFPSGIVYSIPYDTTKFVEISIKEAVKTLLEAVVLVFLVVYVFLQDWRATLIPCVAVPVSIIGTFAGLYLLGFSINTLTLFGLVLAIGIVVDDAIVVLENVERIMHKYHFTPREAVLRAMEEVTEPIIAIVLVLCAVFIPVAFLGGMTGQLYRQFAAAISIAVIISGIVAITLTPVLCAHMLKPNTTKPSFVFFRMFEEYFTKTSSFFIWFVEKALYRGRMMLVAYVAIIGIIGVLFMVVPRNFMPEEDQGFLVASVVLPDGASVSRTQEVVNKFVEQIRHHPAIKDVVHYTGYDVLSSSVKSSAATLWITFKDWGERSKPGMDINSMIGYIMQQSFTVKEAIIFAFNVPSIPGLGSIGGFEAYLQDRGEASVAELGKATAKSLGVLDKYPAIGSLNSNFRANVPQLFADVDREKAKALGLSLGAVYESLGAALSAVYVNDFNRFGKTYKVLLQADEEYRSFPDDIKNIYVRSSTGKMLPITAVTEMRKYSGAEMIEHFNGFLSAHFFGNSAPGYSADEGMRSFERLVEEKLPAHFVVAWTGEAFQAKHEGSSAMWVLLFGVVVIFLILAAQYEQWSLPFAVICAIPFAVVGALLAVFLRGLANDIYFQISIVTLAGLSAKNSILIVEFANLKRKEGLDTADAVLQAVALRFRPIVMTSFTFILGVLPLVLSSGAGANSRHSIGTGVFGGMLFSTFITVVFVPLFYYWLVERRLSHTAKL